MRTQHVWSSVFRRLWLNSILVPTQGVRAMIDRFVLTLLIMLLPVGAVAWDDPHTIEGTFSMIARDTAAGELGMAVQSKAHAVGSRTVSAKGGLGVIAHQAQSNPMYGQVGL